MSLARRRRARNELKIRVWFFVMDQSVLRKLYHYAFRQITPLSLWVLAAVLTRVNRSDDDSTVVPSEFDAISQPDILSVGVFHSGHAGGA